MADTELKQRLAAILLADGVGYSRLMSSDERGTVAALDAARDVFRSHVATHGGRVTDTAGDSVLAVFRTAVGAVSAALAIQQQLAAARGAAPAEDGLQFRIGVHLGDVFEKPDGSVYGDGVNIAARIEGLAEPGGVAVSQSIQAAVQGRVPASFEDIGEQQVKNIAHPVRVYRLHAGAIPAATASARRMPIRGIAVVGFIAVAATVLGLGGWRPWRAQDARLPAAAAASAPAGVANQKTVAVLPFASLSEDKANEYFADGVTDELRNTLSRIPGLRVTARSSSSYFKGKTVPLTDMAHQLGVAYLVDGTVRKAGDHVRIGAQLVNAGDGAVLWSDTFDREFKDVLAAQAEVALQIAKKLKLPLDASSVVGSGTTNAEAWQTFLQAQRLPTGQRDGLYQRALALDPNFTRVYLAMAREAFGGSGPDQPRAERRALSVKYLNEALRIDPRTAEAYGRLASAEMLVDDMDAVRRNVRRALELDPNQIAAHNWQADLAMEAGRIDEALAERSMMLAFDPLSWLPRYQYARVLRLANQPAQALAVIDEALTLTPGNDAARATQAEKAVILLRLGRRDEALTLARRIDDVDVLARAGTREDLVKLRRRTDLDAHDRAAVAMVGGQYDEFFDHLEAEHSVLPERCQVLFDPDVDPVRKLPRFKSWLEKYRLTAAHERAQAWRAANPAPQVAAR
ncbi:MAG TPA: adenylate/guanylate cyclase domain-containing protein [Burkholderiaceae bacterium]|nr:adenylate/guanylate cyclase domain-containing protein [Burkholderiaceae bacterium]